VFSFSIIKFYPKDRKKEIKKERGRRKKEKEREKRIYFFFSVFIALSFSI